jgi:hypothetical protein
VVKKQEKNLLYINMELKFDDPEEDGLDETHEMNYNYWATMNTNTNTKTNTNTNTNTIVNNKKQVSYDDILSSLNMVVHNGVLQFAKNPAPNKLNNNTKNTNNTHANNTHANNTHNYIHNKYFKDYKDESIINEPPRQLTREEYKQLMIQNYYKRLEANRRIAQIKSKKLLFSTQNINISPSQNPRDMNRLFSSFKR